MKATVNTKTLLAAMSAIVRLVPARAALAMQENVLILASSLGLGLSASYNGTDMCVSITPDGGCNVLEDGILLLPARLLLDILKTVEDETVTLGTAAENAALVSWSTGHSRIPSYDEKEFPETRLIPSRDAVTVTFPAGELAAALSATAYACLDDDYHRILNGVLIESTPDGTTFAASDRHKLLVHEVPGVKSRQSSQFTLDKVLVPMVADICRGAKSVTMSIDGPRAFFHGGNATLSAESISGKYPKYRDVIPKNNSNVLTVDRKVFASMIRRVGVLSDGRDRNILFDIRNDMADTELEMTSCGSDQSGRTAETLPDVEYEGEDLRIGFSAQNLQDILGKMEGSEVILRFAGSRQAALITPKTGTETCPTLAVLMPVMT